MSTAADKREASWTAEQRAAVTARDVSVSLSAGAGCGKTYVLTERFLDDFGPGTSEALRPDDLHRLVAITFTERAAREMRDRVRRACYDRLLGAESDADAKYWADLVRGLDTARISTIHSYCASLLRTHAVEAGIDPAFEVLEQAQSETLLSEVVDDELRRLVAQRDRATISLAARFDLHALRNLLHAFVVQGSDDLVERWLPQSPAEQVAAWAEFHRQRVLPAVARRVANSPVARSIVSILRDHVPDHATLRARREFLLDKLPGLAERSTDAAQLAAELRAIREHAKVQGGGTAKNWDDAAAYEAFKAAAEKLRKLVDQVLPLIAFDPAAALDAAVVGGELLTIAAGMRRRYDQRKRELAALDFDDLLGRARKLLLDPDHGSLRRRLSDQIHLLLVDEFQDTDAGQVELVEALAGDVVAEGKLFFVGDPKQSIYRFRGAEPHVFRKLRDRTPERGQMSLTRNFRSQPAILEFVNALFCDDLGPKYEALRPHRDQITARPAVEFLWAAPDPTSQPGARKDDVRAQRRREARWIARRIRELVDSGEPLVCEEGKHARGTFNRRAAKLKDIAILFRALSDVELYEDALRHYGVDYYLVGGHAFYAQQEIFDLLNLLRAVASPSDGVSLAGALRSGFFALADETLFWLATHPEGLAGGLFAAELAPQISVDERCRVAFAASVMRRLRERKDRLRISQLIELAMTLTGYDATLLAEFLGERKLANLRKVIEQARSFERSGVFGLADFIAELSEFVARQPKEPLAATFSEDTDVVRLMTIHQSKGLEFPIVILPDVDRATRSDDDPARLHADLGPLVRLPAEADGSRPAGGYELWRLTEQEEELAELLRLFYVATTRAADYLLLSAGVQHVDKTTGVWTDLLKRRFDLGTGKCIAMLRPDEIQPRVKVTNEEPEAQPVALTRSSTAGLEKLIAAIATSPPAPLPALAAIEPVAPDVGARRQYSFSRLYGTLYRQRPPADDVRGDDISTAGGIDPRGFGTLVHAVLAAIDYSTPGDWRKLVRLHAERQQLGSAEAVEAERLIEHFLKSPRALELARAKQSLVEPEFLLAWPPDDRQDASVLLTGYIDCLYQDTSGGWHVLDFKTNLVGPDGIARAAANYEMQMLVYGLAAERILGAAPKSLTLHFLRAGAEHPFEWDAAARNRARTMVDEAIAAAASPAAPLGDSTYALGGGVL